MTIQQIKNELRKMDPNLKETDDSFHCAVIMLAALQVGQGVTQLAQFTSYTPEQVGTVAERLQKNGIWKNGKTYANWFDKDGAIEFWMHVAVAQGLLERG